MLGPGRRGQGQHEVGILVPGVSLQLKAIQLVKELVWANVQLLYIFPGLGLGGLGPPGVIT